MVRVEGYSLWLIPSGDVYRRLINLIHRLSRRYSTPSFEFHVMLIEDLISLEEDVLSRTLRLCGLIQSYGIELGRVEYLDEVHDPV